MRTGWSELIKARLSSPFTSTLSVKSQQLIFRPDPVNFWKLRSSNLPGEVSLTEVGGLHQNPLGKSSAGTKKKFLFSFIELGASYTNLGTLFPN